MEKQREANRSCRGHSQEAELTGREVDVRILSPVRRLSSLSLLCVDAAVASLSCSVGPGQLFSSYQREQNNLANESVPFLWDSDLFKSEPKVKPTRPS